jgi:hypothetical protein
MSYGTFMGFSVPIFLLFITLKTCHIGKNVWLTSKLNQLLRLDKIYRLVPQLTLFDLYFLRYGPLSGTRLCDILIFFEKN